MNWSTAKNLIIIALLLLNIMQVVLLNMNNMQYVMTEDRVTNIRQVLEANNISLNVDLPYSTAINRFFGNTTALFAPKHSIEMVEFTPLSEDSIKKFFVYTENIERLGDFEQTVYTNGIETLTVNSSSLKYTNPNGTGSIILNEETAYALANSYISQLYERFHSFIYNKTTVFENHVIVDFRDTYQDNIIYSNYIRIRITNYGITEVEVYFYDPVQFYEYSQTICAIDEALLIFMNDIRNIYVETEHIVITKIDLIYYQETLLSGQVVTVRAVPHYRIYIENRNNPFLINAFSNTMI